jgi:hypothetical protein
MGNYDKFPLLSMNVGGKSALSFPDLFWKEAAFLPPDII